MPRRPKLPCRQVGCKELIEPGQGYCPTHIRGRYSGPQMKGAYKGPGKAPDKGPGEGPPRLPGPLWRDRPSSSLRGYGRNHQRLRKLVMAEQPLCITCEAAGRIVPGVEMDHIDGNPYNLERENLQMMCKSCHSRKTAKENRGFGHDEKAEREKEKERMRGEWG